MSVAQETVTRATEFTTEFYNVFTIHWQSPAVSTLTHGHENMLFTMADGTPYHLTGDIGLWSQPAQFD